MTIEEQCAKPVDSSEVTAALYTILATDKFSASPQMSAFLRYVVEQTLIGNSRRIKAFTVAIEALGKTPSFDPQTDPSVRVLAKRLRSSLDTYYQQNPGTPVIIKMKPGSYVPKFVRSSDVAVACESQSVVPAMAALPGSGNEAHLRIEKKQTLSSPTTESAAKSSSIEASEELALRKHSISQFWTAYQATTKAAMVVAILTLSAWISIAAITPSTVFQTASSDVNPGPPVRIELASADLPEPLRERPEKPTLYLDKQLPENESWKSVIFGSLATGLSKSGHLRVIRSPLPAPIGGFWPEEYRVLLDSVVVDEQMLVNVQVLNAETNLIAHASMLTLNPFHDKGLSQQEIASIETYAENISSLDGPLMKKLRSDTSSAHR